MSRKHKISGAWLLVVLGGLLSGCPLFKREHRECEATVTYKGNAVKRKGYAYRDEGLKKARADAVRRACATYCRQLDPAVQIAYGAYKKTPSGKSSRVPRESSLLSVPSLKTQGKKCRDRCALKGASDGSKPTVTCKK